MVRFERIAVAVEPVHLDLARSCDAPPPTDQFDAGTIQPLDLAPVLPIVRKPVPVFQGRLCVNNSRDRFRSPGNSLRRVENTPRSKECFGRNARPVRAFAAHQFAFHNHCRQSATNHPVRHVFPDGARADHNYVEFTGALGIHGRSLQLLPLRCEARAAWALVWLWGAE